MFKFDEFNCFYISMDDNGGVCANAEGRVLHIDKKGMRAQYLVVLPLNGAPPEYRTFDCLIVEPIVYLMSEEPEYYV